MTKKTKMKATTSKNEQRNANEPAQSSNPRNYIDEKHCHDKRESRGKTHRTSNETSQHDGAERIEKKSWANQKRRAMTNSD